MSKWYDDWKVEITDKGFYVSLPHSASGKTITWIKEGEVMTHEKLMDLYGLIVCMLDWIYKHDQQNKQS